jgi:hypothetical protein
MHLEGASKDQSYSSDAVSANTNLTSRHFEQFSTYRLEWQPKLGAGDIPAEYQDNGNADTGAEVDRSPASGHDGYLAWYQDDKFLYRIDGAALDLTGGQVPEEPMYVSSFSLSLFLSFSLSFIIDCTA